MEQQIVSREKRMRFFARILEGNALFYMGVAAFAVGCAVGILLCAVEFGGAITDMLGASSVFDKNTGFFDVFLSFFEADLRILLVLFAFGFTMFGFPTYVAVQTFCGFSMGCSAMVLFSSQGVYALLPVAVTIIPHMLIIMTANAFSAKSIIPVSLRALEIFRKDDIIIVQPPVNISNCMYSFALSAVFAAFGSLLCAVAAVI